MLTKSRLLAITVMSVLASASPALAAGKAGLVQVQDTAIHSHRHTPRHAARVKAGQALDGLTPAERLEPFTAAEKKILDAPDPFYHPDLF